MGVAPMLSVNVLCAFLQPQRRRETKKTVKKTNWKDKTLPLKDRK